MKAAQLVGPKHFEIVDAETPTLNDGNCLVKLERWSVCASDIRHEYGTIFPEEHYPVDVGAPCHELAGTIVESRSDQWQEGQKVIVIPGTFGGLVEYYESAPDRMIAFPDDGDPGEWLMCQPSGTVLFALQQAGTILGKTVLVMGQGPIGLSFTAMAARAGARQVIAADLFDYRLEYSKKFGATHTVNPSKELLDEAVEEITGGALADITVEAAGYPETLAAGARLVKSFGTILMFGNQQNTGESRPTVPLDARSLLYKNARLVSTAASTSGDVMKHIRTMVELRERGWWDPAEMITHQLDFDDVQKTYDMYEKREDKIVKAVMRM
jgi:threonine dehydrogenase-like Zn-dependent dehydrogenase